MLTEGWKSHGSGCGDVSSSRAPVVPGMALQCRDGGTAGGGVGGGGGAPRRGGGGGGTGPEVKEEKSPCWPDVTASSVRARGRHPYLFRGFRHPPLRVATWRPHGGGQHSVTELTLALPHSAEDGRTGQVGGTAPGHDS
jgi:hypothetical protein